ncbi:hypothetical protein [Pseudoxanthomonas winnipegensis]|jgi:hypothetical protein|uniref:DUF2946 domain-containing protein n=1 Tax=Pseudoxanthomonas winnipegensis TaxID=2480810 RepID=A0A4Q8LDP9_9GAMM|nr:hypothetical protein [Pseudoxanthomonas winnipegensis]TAA26695.1 hypothetical protein EA660_05590 [Pseudoxanthomonas winnipegensis]TAA36611.1 hypothetical protein EAT51_19125 [Pseudoxanthomonas winnipegensis]
MSRTIRQLLRLLRLPALTVLLFSVLANPVLATVGDMHEAVRGNTAHLDHPLQAHDASDDAVIDDDGKTGDLLHALMHGVHGCGHQTALPALFVSLIFSQIPAVIPHSESVFSVSAGQTSPIRPPIAG